MAIPTPELQTELLKVELDKKMRGEMKDVLKIAGEDRELNEKENAALIADINKLMAGRDAWLKQMQEAKRRAEGRALTREDQEALEAEVRAALLNPLRRRSVANFKYESDDKPSDPKNANKTGLEGMLSNFGSQLGLGGNPIFDFLGKLFAFIMHFIKGVKETFNPEKVPADSVADLVKEESYDDADAELTKQEHALINKLRSVTDKDGKERDEIKATLDVYDAGLTALKELKIRTEDGRDEYIPFVKTTEAHKKNILESRLKMFNDISSKTASLLADHEELATLDHQAKSKERQVVELTTERNAADDGKHALELQALQLRLAAVEAEAKALKEKSAAVQAREAKFARDMGVADIPKRVTYGFQLNRELLEAEGARQVALDKKAKADAVAAERAQAEEIAHRRAMETARAGHVPVV